MVDVVDRATRSRMMSGIRGKHTKPELKVRSFLHREGMRFRLHARNMPGRPDIVLPRYRTVIFVHGCFWHQHDGCRYAATPSSNVEFWSRKLARNVERDQAHSRALASSGWKVLVVWECEVDDKARLARLIEMIRSEQ
jgi:DNA mismatch endonuclease, patch repair protein